MKQLLVVKRSRLACPIRGILTIPPRKSEKLQQVNLLMFLRQLAPKRMVTLPSREPNN